MQPKISVILPVYNVEKYIEECILSILNQSYQNLEIIVIDDGSQDNSIEMCKKITKNDSRVKYFYKSNSGIADTRNFGIQNSTGEYVTFVDSDDYISRDYINTLYNAILVTKADISICGFVYYYDEINKLESVISNDKFIKVFSNDEILEMMYSFNNNYVVSLVTPWGKLYKRELFNNIQYPRGKNYEDEYTTYKLYIEAQKITYINQELYFYRKRPESIMSKKYSLDNLNSVFALEERLKYMQQYGKNLTETKYSYLCLLSYSHYMLKKNGFQEYINIREKFLDNYIKYVKEFTFKRRIKLFILKYFEHPFYKFKKLKGNNYK